MPLKTLFTVLVPFFKVVRQFTIYDNLNTTNLITLKIPTPYGEICT